ncbi:MAG: hypothetical protein FWE06_06615 [Oscillospiraceae bacterium]|nr:hypothetical protein [Oscillospiraceae bacterium]
MNRLLASGDGKYLRKGVFYWVFMLILDIIEIRDHIMRLARLQQEAKA